MNFIRLDQIYWPLLGAVLSDRNLLFGCVSRAAVTFSEGGKVLRNGAVSLHPAFTVVGLCDWVGHLFFKSGLEHGTTASTPSFGAHLALRSGGHGVWCSSSPAATRALYYLLTCLTPGLETQ